MHQLLRHIVLTIRVLDGDGELVRREQLNVAAHVLAGVGVLVAQAATVRVNSDLGHELAHKRLAAIVRIAVGHHPDDRHLRVGK